MGMFGNHPVSGVNESCNPNQEGAMKKSILKHYAFLTLLSILSLSFLNACAARHKDLVILNPQDFRLLKSDKIALLSIGGWQEAVDILKDSLIDSFLSYYTRKEEEADYKISGNIFAKKHWKSGRLYIYYTVNLRIEDRTGNVVASIRLREPLYQPQLSQFTDEIAMRLKESMLKETETKKGM
jgi:hypothetical protein